MNPIFEAIQVSGQGIAVKGQLRKGGKWYTAADTFCLPESVMAMNAMEMAQFIATALNTERDRRLAKKLGSHFFNSVGHCEFCGLHHEDSTMADKCPGE